MDTLIKEYGSLACAILGGTCALVILFLLLSSMKEDSRYIIASMTGVKAEEIQYIDDVEE